MPPARLLALPIRRYPLAHPFGPPDCWDGLQTRGLAHIFKRCPESVDIKCGISKQGDGISIAQNGRLRTAAVCHRHRRLRRPYCPQGNRTARRSASEPQKLSKSASVLRQRRMRSEKTKKKRRFVSETALYRGGRIRTLGPRLWRPLLYQLSYAPIHTALTA